MIPFVRDHAVARARAMALALAGLVGLGVALYGAGARAGAATLPAGSQGDPAPARARLIVLHQEAVDLVRRAAAPGVAPAERARLLTDVRRHLELLGAEPAASSTAADGPPLFPQTLREELRRGAAALSVAEGAPFAAEPTLKLLDRAGARLKGEPLLGLDFQGSYAQTKVAEPAVGGHASAMGPAPTQVPSAVDAAEAKSPVEFAEVAGFTTKTYCGGPDEGPHPRVGRQRRRALRLRRRRQARRLPRDRRRADRQARAGAAPERPLPQPRGLEVRGRVEEGGSRRRGLGQRGLRRRLRRRRTARPLRHELRPELPLPQQRQRNVHGSGGHGRSRRREAGARAAPSSTRTATATSTSTWRATSRRATRSSERPSAPSPGGEDPRPWWVPWACLGRRTSSS